MASSPSPRQTSPDVATPGRYESESREFTGSPSPADNSLRSRFSSSRTDNIGDASPTSTTLSNHSRSIFRSANPLSTSTYAASFDTQRKQILIRADPSLTTCFDPADKELYELWAPKR